MPGSGRSQRTGRPPKGSPTLLKRIIIVSLTCDILGASIRDTQHMVLLTFLGRLFHCGGRLSCDRCFRPVPWVRTPLVPGVLLVFLGRQGELSILRVC